MKKKLLLSISVIIFCVFGTTAQVTQINANKSLRAVAPLSATKTFLSSDLDSSIWVTDGTLAGTVQISPTIKFNDDWGLLSGTSGTIVFRGSTAATGSEVYISDGTPAGTVLVSDINPGATGSNPQGFSLLNGFLYFSAEVPASGRELWRTNGTLAGTTLVKDIMPGPVGSLEDFNTIFSNGTFLLFAANTASGNELWKSDGSSAGTVLLKDINPGADSSNPDNFSLLNSTVLFTATDATHGNEIWKSDGTPTGTVLLKDINPGTGSSTPIIPGTSISLFLGFHIFNNHAYFNANDGTSAGEIWGTDGSPANTILIKNFPTSATGFSGILLTDAINLSNKFIFPYGDGTSRSELWECNGTAAGTVLFKSFSPTIPGESPYIALPFNVDLAHLAVTYPLFQGNKFFFFAGTSTEGTELWVSDGTLAGTNIVKDINPGPADGIDFSEGDGSYLYTSTTFFFGASDATHGSELWQTNATAASTTLIQDIYPNAGNASPDVTPFITNGKVMFGATDGNPSDETITDLFVLGGTFVPLPVKLLDFTVTPKDKDALLAWSTSQELNTKNFTVQRSYDAQHFEDLGIIQAKGTSYLPHSYTFTDAGIAISGKNIVYYRLLLSDLNGKTVNTNVISLKFRDNSQWNVRLLSNPVQDNVNVILSGIAGNIQLSVRDVNGKTIYTKSMQNVNGQISLPAVLQKGVYILEAETNNERKSVKFVK